MKIFLLSIFLLVSALGYSQQWCLPGAQWTYTYSIFTSYVEESFTRYSYVKDTVVENESCAKLTGIESYYALFSNDPGLRTYALTPVYTFSRNDSIFIWQNDLQLFTAIYFFNAQVGDTVRYKSLWGSSNDTTITQVVDSTGTIEINGKPLRYYYARPLDSFMDCEGAIKIIERIGAINTDMVPAYGCVIDGGSYSLRCYQDDSFALYKTSNTDCDYVRIPASINDERDVLTTNIFPNPATESFTFQLGKIPSRETYLQLFDVLGRPVKKELLKNETTNLLRENLGAGLYLWRLEQEGKTLSVGRIILE